MCYHKAGTACENQIEKDNHLFRNTDQISSPTKSTLQIKTKIISMFYFRSERIVTKNQKHTDIFIK